VPGTRQCALCCRWPLAETKFLRDVGATVDHAKIMRHARDDTHKIDLMFRSLAESARFQDESAGWQYSRQIGNINWYRELNLGGRRSDDGAGRFRCGTVWRITFASLLSHPQKSQRR
jgi:hypothetical protein